GGPARFATSAGKKTSTNRLAPAQTFLTYCVPAASAVSWECETESDCWSGVPREPSLRNRSGRLRRSRSHWPLQWSDSRPDTSAAQDKETAPDPVPDSRFPGPDDSL